MATIVLYGPLKTAFGSDFRLEVSTVAEAIRALGINLPGFLTFLTEPDNHYKVLVDGESVAEEDLSASYLRTPSKIMIIPVVAGAKGGGEKILSGAALLAVAYFAPVAFGEVAGVIGGTSAAGIAQAAAMNIGISLMVTGLAEVLTKPPKDADLSETQRSESYLSNGPKNVSAQGRVIPIGYGRLRVGSRIISAGIESKDY